MPPPFSRRTPLRHDDYAFSAAAAFSCAVFDATPSRLYAMKTASADADAALF